MIYKLRRRLILIVAASVVAVFALIFGMIAAYSVSSVNRTVDRINDALAAGGGKFPEISEGENDDEREDDPPDKSEEKDPEDADPPKPGNMDIWGELRFSTRFFTVYFDEDGELDATYTEHIMLVDADTAAEYAGRVVNSGGRGWLGNYRYIVYNYDDGTAVTFVDASMNRSQSRSLLLGVLGVLSASAVLIILLTVFLSRRAVRPVAESYEKQKQFVTDASHELKTPLTLILANLDIAEAELGHSEWLDDIRTEGRQMSALVQSLVTLSRMDEDRLPVTLSDFSLSDAAGDVASEFQPAAESAGLTFLSDIPDGVTVMSDEAGVRRIISVLLDNAVKYCDRGGKIRVILSGGKHPTLTVENDYAAAEELETSRLFDRFYRADKARTSGSGFGIGLSIAESCARRARASLTAAAGNGTVRFTLSFR